jgi:small-conductance mechanosensitive channel
MRHNGRVLATLVAILCAWVALALAPAAPAAWAKEAKGDAAKEAKLPEPLTKESVRELVSRLSDEEVRRLLLQQLDRAAVPAPPPDGGMAGRVEQQTIKLRDGLREMGAALLALPRSAIDVYAKLSEGGGALWGVVLLGGLAAALGVGLLGERASRRLAFRYRAEVEASADDGLTAKVTRLALRLGLDVLELLVFTVVAAVVMLAAFHGHGASRFLAIAVLQAVVVTRGWALLSRFILAPHEPARRLLPLADRAAAVLHRNLLAVAGFFAGMLALKRVLEFAGTSAATVGVVVVAATLVGLWILLRTIWAVRDDIGALIRGEGERAPVRKLIADFWPFAVGVFVLVIGVARIAGTITQEPDLTGSGIGSLAVLVLLPILDYALCQMLREVIRGRLATSRGVVSLLEPTTLAAPAGEAATILGAAPASAAPETVSAAASPAAGAAPPPAGAAPSAERAGGVAPALTTVETTSTSLLQDLPDSAQRFATSYEPVLRKAIHIVLTVLGFVLIADLWKINLFALAERGLGGQITGALLGMGITLLLAYLLWEMVRTAIDRRMEAERVDGPGASRLRTLLPLLRVTLQITLAVMATLSVLAALGVNILPLLAGAGVVGVAIGFGSQTLVRDIVSGAFFLMDDAFRLGEYIEVGDAKGVVERITIRSLFLRHHRGALNILPYGEIKRLRNTSRDWMIMIMEFRLEAETDIRKVKSVLKRIGEEISGNPELAKDLLSPLKSQGVMAIEDGALVVRAKFTARPGNAPFMIRREAYTRILAAFAEAGIHFANRQVTVFVPHGTTEQAIAQSAAAAAAAAEDEKKSKS